MRFPPSRGETASRQVEGSAGGTGPCELHDTFSRKGSHTLTSVTLQSEVTESINPGGRSRGCREGAQSGGEGSHPSLLDPPTGDPGSGLRPAFLQRGLSGPLAHTCGVGLGEG